MVWWWMFVFVGTAEDVRDELLRAAYEHISALYQEVVLLRGKLDDCMSTGAQLGELADDRRLDITSHFDPNWNVVLGDCKIEGDCLYSANFQNTDGTTHYCGVTIEPNWTGFLDVLDFNDGGTDEAYFYVDELYDMSTAGEINGLVPVNTFLWLGWPTENTSWTICRSDKPSVTDHLENSSYTLNVTWWSTVSGPCRLDVEGCVATLVTRPMLPNQTHEFASGHHLHLSWVFGNSYKTLPSLTKGNIWILHGRKIL